MRIRSSSIVKGYVYLFLFFCCMSLTLQQQQQHGVIRLLPIFRVINKLTTTTITSHTILRRREETLLRLHQVPSQPFVSRRVDTTEVDKSSFFNVVYFSFWVYSPHVTTQQQRRQENVGFTEFLLFLPCFTPIGGSGGGGRRWESLSVCLFVGRVANERRRGRRRRRRSS